MAIPKIYVDGRLVTWADTLFSPPYRPVKQHTPRASKWILLPLAFAAGSARAQIERTVHKVPEVLVKITNKKGAGRGMANIRNHLDYISRNARLELEDQNGELIRGRSDLNALKDNLQISSGRRIPDEEGNTRHALNVVFSMAPGTPPEKVKEAVREFAQEEFAGREYVFVLHTDTLHPHVHLVVKTAQTPDLKRLRPGRDDLQRWRQGFAERLRANGIEANASARRTRGVVKYPLRQVEIHRAKRLGIPAPQRAVNVERTPQFAQREREAWKAVTKVLNQSEVASDVRLAKQVLQFWKQTAVAGQTSASLTERNTRVRQHIERGWRLAAARIHQSHSSQIGAGVQPKARPLPDLWSLPSRPVAPEQGEGASLLLYTDAPDYLGRQRPADPGVRWPDSRSVGASTGRTVSTPASPAAVDQAPAVPGNDRKR